MSQTEPIDEADPDPVVSKRENELKVVPVKEDTQICGLRRKTFFTVLVILLLVVAIVGGVEGGVVGKRDKSICHRSFTCDVKYPLTPGS